MKKLLLSITAISEKIKDYETKTLHMINLWFGIE